MRAPMDSPHPETRSMHSGNSRGGCPCLILLDSLFSSQLLEKQTDGLDPVMEVRYVELFVGRVQVIVGKTEAHHYCGDFQSLIDIIDDGDRSAAADETRFFL